MSKFRIESMINNTTSGSPTMIKLIPALFLLMFYLKATGAVTWSWWVIWSPIWGLALGAVVLAVLIAIVAHYAEIDLVNTDE